MKTKSLTLFLVAAILLAGCSALGMTGTNASNQLQSVSGIVEATEVPVAAQLPGRVVAVSVAEGDQVKVGDVLFRLDDSLYKTQLDAAKAALASANAGVQTAQAGVTAAQAQYDLVLSSALAAAQPDRVDAWKLAKPSDFDQPSWYFSTDERLKSTQAAVEAAKTDLQTVQTRLDDIEKQVGSAQYMQAEQRLSDARVAFQITKTVLDQTSNSQDGQKLHDAAQKDYDDAKRELDLAQQAYDDTLTTSGAQDVLEARAKVSVAQERYDASMDALRLLQTGANAPEVTAASSQVDQAQAMLTQAQTAVDQAQSQVDLIEAQIAELTVLAPLDGTVLARSVEVGQVLQAGATALTIGQLDQLKVTVYLPENRYGEVSLGQQVSVSADSFPGETFTASVAHIADQAEFTPQNVQTQENRQTTVYAVELSLDNTEGKLKPGMPVSVDFTK
jgi:HlyD family secretion protein